MMPTTVNLVSQNRYDAAIVGITENQESSSDKLGEACCPKGFGKHGVAMDLDAVVAMEKWNDGSCCCFSFSGMVGEFGSWKAKCPLL
jgi:hypothetical protein